MKHTCIHNDFRDIEYILGMGNLIGDKGCLDLFFLVFDFFCGNNIELNLTKLKLSVFGNCQISFLVRYIFVKT